MNHEVYKHLIMYANSEVMIHHILPIQMVGHFPSIMKIFIYWFLKWKVTDEIGDKNLMQSLGPWLDPTYLLPMVRTVVLVNRMQLRVLAMSNTDVAILTQLQRPMKQLGIRVSWEEARGREKATRRKNDFMATLEAMDLPLNRTRSRSAGNRK